MTTKITALLLAGLLSSCSISVVAAEKDGTASADSKQSPRNESSQQQSVKSGEEASGGTAGADSETLKKDADTASGNQKPGK